MAKKKWFEQGKKGAEKAKALDKQAAEERKRRQEEEGPRRFWLANDSSGKFTFLDTPEFFRHEHNLKINGKYHNYETCLKDIDICPPCEDGDKSSYTMSGTGISHREYEDREGNIHKNQKMLIVFKGTARQTMQRRIETHGPDLRGHVFQFTRGSKPTECGTGEDIEHIGKLSDEQMKKFIPKGEDESWLEPADYEKVFAPKTPEDLRKLMGKIEDPVGGGEDESGDEVSELISENVDEDGGIDVDDLL